MGKKCERNIVIVLLDLKARLGYIVLLTYDSENSSLLAPLLRLLYFFCAQYENTKFNNHIHCSPGFFAREAALIYNNIYENRVKLKFMF